MEGKRILLWSSGRIKKRIQQGTRRRRRKEGRREEKCIRYARGRKRIRSGKEQKYEAE